MFVYRIVFICLLCLFSLYWLVVCIVDLAKFLTINLGRQAPRRRPRVQHSFVMSFAKVIFRPAMTSLGFGFRVQFPKARKPFSSVCWGTHSAGELEHSTQPQALQTAKAQAFRVFPHFAYLVCVRKGRSSRKVWAIHRKATIG